RLRVDVYLDLVAFTVAWLAESIGLLGEEPQSCRHFQHIAGGSAGIYRLHDPATSPYAIFGQSPGRVQLHVFRTKDEVPPVLGTCLGEEPPGHADPGAIFGLEQAPAILRRDAAVEQIDAPDELCDEAVRRTPVDLTGLRTLGDASIVHDGDAVRQREGFL